MRIFFVSFVVLLALAPFSCAQDYAVGADVSFLGQAEQKGVIFKDNDAAKPGLQILKDHGYNWIRLRIFHTPTDLPNNLEYTIALARQAKKLGFKFLLDFHYADDWADPGKQPIPKAWLGKRHAQLVQAVFEYTRDTIATFRDAGVLPDMVHQATKLSMGCYGPMASSPKTGTTLRNWFMRESTESTPDEAIILAPRS